MYHIGVGRRKKSVARLFLKEGGGNFSINKRDKSSYLNNQILEYIVNQPFDETELRANSFDIKVNVRGGGPNGQAEALRLALTRALEKYNPELRPALKKAGLLTVDDRQVERKKYGLRKARRSRQFSKR